ncbi:MAG: hypothetical protein ACE5JL_03015 [Dehalococcoidia bacterium]
MKWVKAALAVATFLVAIGVIAVENPLRDAVIELINALTDLIRAIIGTLG